jgi:glucokinase
MSEIVVADIGGTNARFAIARLGAREVELGPVHRYGTADHGSLDAAWRHFERDIDRDLPRSASIAIAAPLGRDDVIKLTNSPWKIQPASLAVELGLEWLHLVNDFGAMAHAVATLPDEQFEWIGGPERERPGNGVITVIGPGTGLGVAMALRRNGRHEVVETEGGHIEFAPLDEVEQRIVDRLRGRYGRVSAERIVSGPGLANIYGALAKSDGGAARIGDDAILWASALDGSDPLAATALDRLCMSFGSVAGDIALAQGASAVVITGNLAQRMADRLRGGAFLERFRSKGRYRGLMAEMPILLCVHPEPGLHGAAVAFRTEQDEKGRR